VFLCVLGISKSVFSYSRWYTSAAETLIVGAVAAAAAYLLGLAFEGIQ